VIQRRVAAYIACFDTANKVVLVSVNNRKTTTTIIITELGPHQYPCYWATGYAVPVGLHLDTCTSGRGALPAGVAKRLTAQQRFEARRRDKDSVEALQFDAFTMPGNASVQNGVLLITPR
jgi:hypothetical protein